MAPRACSRPTRSSRCFPSDGTPSGARNSNTNPPTGENETRGGGVREQEHGVSAKEEAEQCLVYKREWYFVEYARWVEWRRGGDLSTGVVALLDLCTRLWLFVK